MRKYGFSLFVALCVLLITGEQIVRAQTPVTFVKRAEACMILLKSAGVEIDTEARTGNIYPDVVDGEWHVPYLIKAMELGMIDVDGATGLVQPYRSVTRVEFLRMMARAFGLTTNIAYGYEDVDHTAWYVPYIGLSTRYGLLHDPATPYLLHPDFRVTHHDAARAIYVLLTAEPQLQPKPGSYTPSKNEESKPKLVETIQETTEEVVETYVSVSTPKSVRKAMMKLFRSKGSTAERTKIAVVEAVNAERARYKLPPLTTNYYLEESSQKHAKDMEDRGYFSHFTPEGESYVERIKQAGYVDSNPEACSCAASFDIGGQDDEKGPDYVIQGTHECNCSPLFSLGENIAKGQLTVEQVMQDWMNSPSHRTNILRPEFEEIGIGIFGDVWVQNFGRLKFEY